MLIAKTRRCIPAALFLLLVSWLGGCAASQEEGSEDPDALEAEVGTEEGATEGDGTVASEESELEDGNLAEGDAQDPGAAAAEGSADQGQAYVDGGNSTDNNLQEIISEINGTTPQPGTAPAEAVAASDAAAATPAPDTSVAATIPAGPAGGALPEFGSKMAYVVEPGDTLATIATKVLGDKKAWKEIAALSGITNPNRIYAGDVVYYQLNEKSQAFAQGYEARPRKALTVGPGDTLARISTRVFGNADLWRSIWRENDRIGNPDRLKVGMQVVYFDRGTSGAQTTSSSEIKIAQAKKSGTVHGSDMTVDQSAPQIGSENASESTVDRSPELVRVSFESAVQVGFFG